MTGGIANNSYLVSQPISQRRIGNPQLQINYAGAAFERRPYRPPTDAKEQIMLGTIFIVILVVALVGALPRWSHSRDWGYAPTGGLGLALVIVVVLLILGRL